MCSKGENIFGEKEKDSRKYKLKNKYCISTPYQCIDYNTVKVYNILIR